MHCYQVNAWLGHLFQVKIDLICGSIGDIACTCVPVNLYLFIQKYIFGQCSSSVYNNAHVIIIQCQQQTLWGLKWGWNPWSSVPHILTILRVSTCSALCNRSFTDDHIFPRTSVVNSYGYIHVQWFWHGGSLTTRSWNPQWITSSLLE